MPHPRPWLGFDALVRLVDTQRVAVLSGAGVSTESGIPDYRGPESRQRDHTPIQYDEFIGDENVRRHYWARSTVGWPSFRAAEPNAGHRALARLEDAGSVRGIITQNVDGLHQQAGSANVIELHGALSDVRCLECDTVTSRDHLQERLRALNPGWMRHASAVAPDGDARIPRSETREFCVPECRTCGGVLKPKVIFFGENTRPGPVERAWSLLEQAEVLLVLGSSLHVYSGYRFVRGAADAECPVAIVNVGPTRGDSVAEVRIDAQTGQLLPQLADVLGARRASSR